MLIVSIILLVGVPFVIGAINGVTPSLKGFLVGFAKVGIIYIPVAIVEFLVYTPSSALVEATWLLSREMLPI